MIKDAKDLDTKSIHSTIVQLSTILELLSQGIYQGGQSMNVVNSINFVNPLRDSYITEFVEREDAESVAPEVYAEIKKYQEEKISNG